MPDEEKTLSPERRRLISSITDKIKKRLGLDYISFLEKTKGLNFQFWSIDAAKNNMKRLFSIDVDRNEAGEIILDRRSFLKATSKVATAVVAASVISKPVESLAKIILEKLQPGKYYLQFSANKEKQWADNNFEILRKNGFYSVFLYADDKEKDYKVLIGPFDREEHYKDHYERLLDLIDKHYSDSRFAKEFMVRIFLKPDFLIVKVVRLEEKEPTLEPYQPPVIENIEPQVTKKLDEKDICNLAEQKVKEYNAQAKNWYGEPIDSSIIKAIIKKESTFNPYAIGYDIEKRRGKWVVAYHYDPKTRKMVKLLRAKGLMQMALVALKEDIIFERYFHNDERKAEQFFYSDKIFEPEINIELGIGHFAFILYRMTFLRDDNGEFTRRIPYKDNNERINFAIAAYNGGAGGIKSSMTRYREKKGLKPTQIRYAFNDVKKHINDESSEYVIKVRKYQKEYSTNA